MLPSGALSPVLILNTKANTSIYGVTTGFGGSADTRSSDVYALQLALMEVRSVLRLLCDHY